MNGRRQPVAAYPLPVKPHAGVGLHFSSLPSPYGIGDIGDAARSFVDGLVEMNMRVWQFLPTGPTAYGDSPYQPLSAFAGNENLIGLEPLVRAGLLEDSELECLLGLPMDSVDYGALIPRKSRLLKLAASRFDARAGNAMKVAFAEFVAQFDEAWLADYAVYRVLKSHFDERPWPEWPAQYRRRDSAALAGIRQREAAAIECYKLLQFFFDQQWRHLKAHASEQQVCLFGDMPIYIALDSADAWAHPEILCIDKNGTPYHVAGVPPDYFSDEGQLWGNPLYDWVHHAANDYRWWVDRIKHAALQFDLIRIDHFRGFEAYWSVPFAEATARNGSWEPGPGDELFLAIQAALGPVPIVAEDLGVITPAVDALRHRFHIPGMVVLQFAVNDPDFAPEMIDPHSVCYTGTHDNDTTVGWFQGGKEDTRSREELLTTRENALRVTGGSAQSIHLDMVRLAFNTPARLAIVPMQDLLGLGSAARLNTPGTTMNNWRWRLTGEQFTAQFRRAAAQLVGAGNRG